MTKNEKILKAQVKELEKLVELKNEVIKELKDIRVNHNYNYNQPYFYPNNWYTTGTSIVVGDGSALTDTTSGCGDVLSFTGTTGGPSVGES